ncbi:MAG: hypothetical protein Q9163_003149 [Psora crenata]
MPATASFNGKVIAETDTFEFVEGNDPNASERMAEHDDAEYNNTHRAFLQAFIARSTLTFEEAQPVLAAILGAHERRDCPVEDITEHDFRAYVSTANNAISPYDLEIRCTYHQITRQRIYALVNSTSDPVTQLATIHTADEISYLKRILDAMFDTYNTSRHEVMAISSMEAVGLAKSPGDKRGSQTEAETQGSSGQSLTMMQAEKVLRTLVEGGWFEKSRKGFYSLTPRALMELRGWLIQTYNDDDENTEDGLRVVKIKQCYACKELITTGLRCANRDCLCRLHDICTQRFFSTQTSRTCPLCETNWTGKDFVGERAAVGMKRMIKRRSTNGGNDRSSFAVAVQREDGSDIEAEEDSG